MMCDWCWARAYARAFGDTRSQAEHYRDVLAEQDARGIDADCPTVMARARAAIRLAQGEETTR